ncbi:MAG: hypothetical protein M1839_004844 [Geoglossum umbratile]|nr:MAG: hypothetical protein M1839_004844 [Geoglossum umbratile]
MAEHQSPKPESNPPSPHPAMGSSIPQKRAYEDEHIPAVSSPLNPDVTSSRLSRVKEKAPIHREQREKKESLKKRESKASSVNGADFSRGTPDRSIGSGKFDGPLTSSASVLGPTRYNMLPAPKPSDYLPPRGPVLTPHHTKPALKPEDGPTQFYEISEHVHNRKGFRYIHCVADPAFPSSHYYRQSETEPFTSCISFEDSSPHILFDQSAKQITTEKGFRMARANVGVREGRWYWECRITSGIGGTGPESAEASTGTDGQANNHTVRSGGHIRLGWARREANLEAPVGFDAYSYGLRDVAGQKVHQSRPKNFFPAGEDISEGDVIGLEINLPSLAMHRKVVEGHYNPAVDVNDDVEDHGAEAPDIIRDRIPVPYKNNNYFEEVEYQPTKDLEDLMNPSPLAASSVGNGAAAGPPPNPTHPLVPLRTLPNSSIKIYKNGKFVGIPFTDLLSFLPPASKPLAQPGTREGLDDGMLGYFPAISVYRGGAAEVNLGPDFWNPPPEDQDVDTMGTETRVKKLRPVCERYNEQIAEDITYDLVDEVDFWLRDGGLSQPKPSLLNGPTRAAALGPSSPCIGLAVTQYLLRAPQLHNVVVVARSREPLETLKTQYPTQVQVVCGDLSDLTIGKKAVELAVEKWGRLDSLVLNHGVLDAVARLEDLEIEAWKRTFDLNFFSILGFVKAALGHLRRCHGSVIFTSSGAAASGYATWGAYGASKGMQWAFVASGRPQITNASIETAAINHLALTLANEEELVTSISVRPGVVDTEMQREIREVHNGVMSQNDVKRFSLLKEQGQLLRPEQPGHVIAKLALGAPKWLSGQFLRYV